MSVAFPEPPLTFIVIVSPPIIVFELLLEIFLILSFKEDTLEDKDFLVCELFKILAP